MGSADVLPDANATPRERALRSGDERNALESVPERGGVRGRRTAGVADERGDHLRERGGETGDGSGRACGEPLRDERLGADEDIEPLEEKRLDPVERLVRHLHPGEVRRALAQALDDLDGERVPDPGVELVEVEGHRRTCARDCLEVGDERIGVELEVRRRDDGDPVDSERGRVLGERDGIARRLRPAMDDEREAPGALRGEALGGAAALVEREEEPFARRSEREDAVEAAVREEGDERREGVLVERFAAVAKRRRGCGQRAPDHERNLSSPPMSSLRVERDGPVLRVTLARPERRNAFDAELIGSITAAFAGVGDARAVVLAGEGESFCAGADVEWQRSSIDLTYQENVADAGRLHAMMEAVDACPAPVVVRVHGYALGGGSGLVACADAAIAARDATFGFSEVKLGIVPAVISPYVLAKIGAQARRYFVTGERFDAETALRIGLVSEVADDLDEAVERVVDAILTSGPAAAREAKRLVRVPPGPDELPHLAARMRTGEEGQAGLRAFLDKTPPPWKSGSSS